MRINFYKIVNEGETMVYVGSTKKDLKVRLAEHIISHYNSKYKNKNPLSSYYIIDSNYFKIDLIEEVDCISNKERLQKEQEYINQFSGINKNRAYSEFNQKSKESWASYQRDHYSNHKDQHILRKKAYYKNNKHKILNKYKVKRLFQELPFNI